MPFETDSDPSTIILEETATDLDMPWHVVVYDDPVNLMTFVTLVFRRVFGYSEEKATTLMLEVHNLGQSIVWTGAKEKAEHYVHQLQSYQLLCAMKKST